MFCPDCGTQNEETAQFCSNCGRPLRTKETLPHRKSLWLIPVVLLAIALVIMLGGLAILGSDPFVDLSEPTLTPPTRHHQDDEETLVTGNGEVEKVVTQTSISRDLAESPAVPETATSLVVSAQREVNLHPYVIQSLSPDGKWLVAWSRDEVCIHSTDTLTKQSCAAFQVWPAGIAWSPDSKRIAFTENSPHYFLESDLWTMDVRTGDLSNLTDDGVDGDIIPEKQSDFELDVMPLWTPDGKSLVFARTGYTEGKCDGTALYTIPEEGGIARKLVTVSNDLPLVITTPMHWAAAGTELIYTYSGHAFDNPSNGVWVVDRNGYNPTQILAADNPMPRLMVMGASDEASRATVYSEMIEEQEHHPRIALLDLNTGVLESIKSTSDTTAAIFSPDGSKLLYTHHIDNDSSRIKVRDVASTNEQALLTVPIVHTDPNNSPGLHWAENDTVYISTSSFTGLLLALEE